ncbi:MAG: NTP transferase domain-containing protein [Phycisphaerales bacterium]|nr:NTP transferase domain-containing protein [Phycisphaerales bacterium]
MPTLVDEHTLVLAAGRGKRMGSPKALMNVGGEPWWVRQKRRIETLGLRQTWVVSDAVRTAMWHRTGAPEFVVASASEPMFESLVAGLIHLGLAPPRGVFVLPVDVPAPDGNVFRALAGANSVAVPVFRGATGHPVYLPWGWVCDRILTGEQGGRAAVLLGEHRRLDRLTRGESRFVDVADPAISFNLNTPGDLGDWEAAQPDGWD